MAAHFEARSALPDQREVNEALVDALALAPGMRVLDVGSGTGVLCRRLPERVGPGGFVAGADLSIDLCRFAGCHSVEKGSPAFVVAAAEHLPWPNESFEVVCATRLLLHVPDPLAVTREMARVVAPAGLVVLMDWDFGTAAVDHSDRDLTGRLLHWRTQHLDGDNWSGRRLFGHLAGVGLEELSVRVLPSVVRDERTSLARSLFRAAALACEAGAVTAAERDRWLAEVRHRFSAGTFVASVCYFLASGRRPAPYPPLR